MSDIIVKFKPQGDRQLVKAIRAIQNAKNGLGNATDETNKKLKAFETRNKRNSQSMGNLGLAFSTVRSKMLLFNFAMGLGIQQMIQFGRQAAQLESVERAFNNLSGGTNKATIAIDKLRAATNDTVSDFDLFQQANNAMILGVSNNADEMARLFDMAQRLGRAMGVDTRRSVESLITGIGRQSRLMLDNLGIIVSSEKAYQKFADENGILASALTDAQKKQAFFNEALRQGESALLKTGDEVISSQDKIDQLGSAFINLNSRIGELVFQLTPLIDGTTKFVNAITSDKIKTAFNLFKNIAIVFISLKASAFILANALRLIGLRVAASISSFTGTTVVVQSLRASFVTLTKKVIEFIGPIKSAAIALGAFITTAQEFLFGNKEIIKSQTDLSNTFIRSTEFFTNYVEHGFGSYNAVVGETVGLTIDMVEMQNLLEQAYRSSEQGQLKLIDSQIEYARVLAELGLLTPEQEEGLMALEEQYFDLSNSIDEATDSSDKANKKKEKEIRLNKQLMQSAAQLGSNYKNAGKAAEAAAKNAVAAKIQEALINYMAEALSKIPFPLSLGVPALGAAMAGALGSVLSGFSANQTSTNSIPKLEAGGLIGGKLHSQGGTLIEAERGEFVMSRKATESIGLETLNQMNQGSGANNVIVNVSGNVMTQDFVEGELAESIKEAVRRGSDFGLS